MRLSDTKDDQFIWLLWWW